MNKHQAIALLVVTITGCSAPRPLLTDAAGIKASQQRTSLSRLQSVAQLQVDAASVYGQMIGYYTTPADTGNGQQEPAPMQTVTRYLDAVLAFKPGSTELQPAYNDNRTKLERFDHELTVLTAQTGAGLKSLRITGYASPDGSTSRNEALAAGRARSFAAYLNRQHGIAHQKISIDACVEDWDGLKRLVTETGKPYAAQVVAVLDQMTDLDARRKALQAVDKGRVWKDMERTLFGRLRRMELTVVCEWQEPVQSSPQEIDRQMTPDLNRLLQLFHTRPEQLTLNELLAIATVFRPGTEQYREVYEQAAYRFPDCIPAQLNAGAAALAKEDTEAARFFLERVKDNPHAWINLGVLALMEYDAAGAADWFRKALPVKPLQARTNLQLLKMIEANR